MNPFSRVNKLSVCHEHSLERFFPGGRSVGANVPPEAAAGSFLPRSAGSGIFSLVFTRTVREVAMTKTPPCTSNLTGGCGHRVLAHCG